MRKFYSLLLIAIFSFSVSFAQNKSTTGRKYVLVEIATGTWCGYCPGAAMAADDLHENGQKVAIIENHNGDGYETAASNSRISLYKVTGFPTAVFDGEERMEGGNPSASLYSSYLPLYDDAIKKEAEFEINTKFKENASEEYELTIELNNVALNVSRNLYLHVVYTESHIDEYWNGQTEVNFVNRGMYPDKNGTKIDPDNEINTINVTVKPDKDWKWNNSELVIFVQNTATDEVLQTDKIDLADPPEAVNEIADKVMKIYPNPANNIINIDLSENISKNISLKITDITGKQVFIKEYEKQSKININTDNFNSGLYFINIEDDTHSYTKKISIIK